MGFKCRWCHAVFDNYIDWKLHEDVHRDLDDIGAEMESVNTCRWCSAVFTSASEFIDHENIHEQLDELADISSIPLECPWCEAVFDDRNEFSLHTDIHKQLEELGAFMPAKKCKIDDENTRCHSPLPGPSTEFDSNVSSPNTSDVIVNQQSGGGNGNGLVYEIKKVGEKTFQNKVIDRHYRVKFNPHQALEGQKLSDLNAELENMFDDVLKEAKTDLQASDLGRVIIHHDDLINPIYVPVRPLDELNADTILDYLENTLTSHQDLTMDDGFYLDVGTMELPRGGRGNAINNLIGPNSSLATKRSILEIKNQDDTCLARAILLGYLRANIITMDRWNDLIKKESLKCIDDLVLKYKTCPRWYFDMIKKEQNRARQTDLTLKFCRLVDVPTDRFLTITDICSFEDFLEVDVLVVSARMGNKFIRVPSEENIKKRLYVYLVGDGESSHFHAIINICGFFGASKFCEYCLKPYQNKHDCKISCYVCNEKECPMDESTQMSCLKCHLTCRSEECFDRHLIKRKRKNKEDASMCDLHWRCLECWKVLKTEERPPQDHRCEEWFCQCCKEYVDPGHLCYLRTLEAKKSICKFIFFDIETTQNEIMSCKDGYLPIKNNRCKCTAKDPCEKCSLCNNCKQSQCGKYQHNANLVIAQKVCTTCINETLSSVSKCEDCGSRCKKCKKYNKEEKCYEFPPCEKTCGFREMIFTGDRAMTDFGQWLFERKHKDFTVLAHNMRSFDGYFLLEYLIDQSIRPDKVIYSGSKIMYMHVTRGLNIRIIDSLNFLPMKLSSLPEAFSLTELKKGYFPHFFNKPENFEYVGSYPDPHYYGCDYMSTEERGKFMSWHRQKALEGATFDFKREIVEYCRSDVQILRQACLKFREILMDITGKEESFVNEEGEPQVEMKGAVDPFNDITIASVCSTVFRTKFLKENWEMKLRNKAGEVSDWISAYKKDGEFFVSMEDAWLKETALYDKDYIIEESRFVDSLLAQVPSGGYSRDQYSMKSIKWLELLMHKSEQTNTPIHIQHALNDGEVSLTGTRYKFDGYCESNNTVYEFLGCLYHGCKDCYPDKRHQIKMPRTKQSLEELYALTFKKRDIIHKRGMKYRYTWEHEFDQLLKEDKYARGFVNSLDLVPRLDPRDSFFGGRTNAIRLKYEIQDNEKIKYYDFTSLYPYINKYSCYPVKEPEIITKDIGDIERYFGIAKVKVLPPRGLYFPVLPLKCNGKLMFPLCRTCVEVESQETCRCTDEQRAITGTWCTPELIKAKELGYRILKIYEIYHWNESTQYNPTTMDGGLFSEYINLFLKIKQENSGRPSWVETEEDLDRYMTQYFEKEGIRLDKDSICKNKALRSLAKLLLNSFWGKFGQRLNMPQHDFFHDAEAASFFRCISDPKKNVKDFHIISNDTVLVCWENKEEMIEENFQTNIFIATFTTCWARLKLYSVLEKLQDRVLYHDTDSVIFVSRPDEEEPELGDFLGELTSELPEDEHIEVFVSGGPKQYGYKTNKNNTCCKIRGFNLNFTNGKRLNFDSMLELVTNKNIQDIAVVNPHKICRDKRKRKLYNRVEKKKYKIVYNKRVIQKGTFDTLPYGY